jgi:hypothetical protein
MINLKECGRQRSCPTSRYYPGICLEGIRETTKNISHDSRCPGRDLNTGHSIYEAGVFKHRFVSSHVSVYVVPLKKTNVSCRCQQAQTLSLEQLTIILSTTKNSQSKPLTAFCRHCGGGGRIAWTTESVGLVVLSRDVKEKSQCW